MPERDRSSSQVFVGRADELAAACAVLARARDGQAGALLIQGDAGVGKTELVEQVLRQSGEGLVALRGAALPLTSMTVPYLPLRAALTRHLAEASDEPSAVFDGAQPMDVPFAFDAWVAARCRQRPLVLVIDDLHWADASTLDSLLYLLSGPANRRLAVLLTLRREEVAEGHRLNRWLADVRRLPGAQQVDLGPFDRATTELQLTRLLHAPPHQSLVDDVLARSGGNAYLIRLLVKGLPPESRRLPDVLPADLDGALLANWHQLSGPARELTKVIAIGGRKVGPATLEGILGGESPLRPVSELLREGVAAGVLDQATDGSYWFHHPLPAQCLQGRVPDDERRTWHARFAAHLEGTHTQTPVDVEALVAVADHHHLAGHQAQAYSWARAAAVAAGAAGGVHEQIRLLRQALQLRDHAVRPPARVELLRELQAVAAHAADHESELDTVEQLLSETSDEAEPLLRAELLVRRSHLRFSTGREFLSLADIEQARDLSSRAPDTWQHAWVLAALAHVGMWAQEPGAADSAELSIAAARRIAEPRALSYALTAGSIAACFAGDDARGLALADEGRRAAIEARDYWAYVHASLWEMNCIAPHTSPEGALHATRRRRELQALGGPHPYVAWLAVDEAAGWVHQGRWDLAAEPLRIALGANPGGLVDVGARLTAARLAAFQGRIEEALAHLQRADELCDSSLFLQLESDAVRAEVLLAAGDPEGAFASALRGATLPGVPPTFCERLIPLAARGLAELVEEAQSRGDDLRPVLQRVDDLVTRFPRIIVEPGLLQPRYLAQAGACTAWYAAELGRARHDPDNATAWETVVGLAGAALMRWDAAYAGLHAARAHLSAGPGHRQAAAQSLRASHRLAGELAAGPILDAVRQLAKAARLSLAEPESTEPGSARYTLPGLTAREQDVLAHIVAGRTYREIADSLVVSEKTVSTHVSNMLRKYGLANRVELAQRATRQTPPQ